MVKPSRSPANGFVRGARKVYNPIGFGKGYNFVLFFIFAGALFGFSLARLQYLNFSGIFCGSVNGQNHAAPGECYYYTRITHERVGIILHLATILPAGLLVCFQFVPAIRHKAIIFHRINGYLCVILAVLSSAGALMIGRTAFGGTLSTQMFIGFTTIIFLGSLVMAYINVKRLQIEQHRAWMLRAWFYAASIITTRIIMIIAAQVVTAVGSYWYAMPCGKVASIVGSQEATIAAYPECKAWFDAGGDNGTSQQHALVHADFGAGPESLAAAMDINFGAALWLALALHAVGIEIYLHLTPVEAERLRNVSYQRQLEAGMKNPGRAGLTSDRLGDAEVWKPKSQRHGSESTLAAAEDSPESQKVSPGGH